VYLVAENMPSMNFSRRTIAHETLGHYGFSVLKQVPEMGPRLDNFMERLYKTEREGVDAIGKQYGYDTKDAQGRMLASEEWLARQAESDPRNSWVKKAIALVRQWLAKSFPNLKVSNAEISAWLGQMQQAVVQGAPGVGTGINQFAQPRMSLQDAVEKIKGLANFKKWFGDSKVVDEQGNPLVVYHGSDAVEDFSVFRKTPYDVGIHFGSAEVANSRLDWKAQPRRKGGPERREYHRIIPAYVRLENPVQFKGDPTMWDPDNLPFYLRENEPGLLSGPQLSELESYESQSFDAEAQAADEYGINLDDIEAKGNEEALERLEELRGEVEQRFTEAFVDMLKAKGYDGIIYQNNNETTNRGIELSYIAFSPPK